MPFDHIQPNKTYTAVDHPFHNHGRATTTLRIHECSRVGGGGGLPFTPVETISRQSADNQNDNTHTELE